ncbi:MAG TPA: TIGR03621 family F420-dependent LLM class oxidoreductase [Candidatus Sulfotelmatobacter sp.]|nr:TIGR03621 family F420-dependent LLM class oxidoreductase [Candidatus Sulfotelmatobacter sp.]
MRPFRFMAEAGAIVSGDELAATARRAEAMGYSVLLLTDHLIEQLAPIPAMTAIAGATSRLRVGTFVLNNELRHPAVLAQDLATIDVLSGGRLEVGIGAGWNKPEFDHLGLAFEPVPARVARLVEAVAILKGCFGDGPFSYRGEHYRITDYDAQPKPVQQPHPPLLIGGGGRRTLELAAREADIVGLAPRVLAGERTDPRSITFAAAAEKIDWVRAAAGDRFDRLEFNVYPSSSPIIITDHARAEAAKIRDRLLARTGYELTEDEILGSPHVFIGSVDGLVAKFQDLRERLGISSFMTGRIDELAPIVERLVGT